MANSIIAEGKTTAEAVEKGLKELKVSKDMVDVKVLEEGDKRSFYSILTPRVVKVELTVKENVRVKEHKEEAIKQEKRFDEKEKKTINKNQDEIDVAAKDIDGFLKRFLKDDVKYEVKVDNFDVYVNINGENVNYLIGYRGETINALQILISAIANKKASSKIRIYLDIAGYKDKRLKTLEDLADKIAKTVIRTGKSVTLEPMSAYERKIIHSRLQLQDRVKTFSKGEEPYRKVVVTPASSTSSEK